MKLLISDVDGILTNGNVSFSSSGDIIKTFNVKDGMALQRLTENGWTVVFVSKSTDGATRNRLAHLRTALGVSYYLGVENKRFTVTSILDSIRRRDRLSSLPKFVGIGDDTNDLEFLEMASLVFCPSDAHLNVMRIVQKNKTGKILSKPGGSCFVEMANHLLSLPELFIKKHLGDD